MNALVYALSSEEFDRGSDLETRKEILGTLEISHEGTNQVKE